MTDKKTITWNEAVANLEELIADQNRKFTPYGPDDRNSMKTIVSERYESTSIPKTSTLSRKYSP